MSFMLTRKQLWRRTPTTRKRDDIYNFLLEQEEDESYLPSRVYSDPTLFSHASQGVFNNCLPARPWNTTGDLDSNQQKRETKGKKRVKFDTCIKVVLIACREEYSKTGLSNILWYKEPDFSSFKSSALMELKAMILLHNIDSKLALKRMYQPDVEASTQNPSSAMSRSRSEPVLNTSSDFSSNLQLDTVPKDLDSEGLDLSSAHSVPVVNSVAGSMADEDQEIQVEMISICRTSDNFPTVNDHVDSVKLAGKQVPLHDLCLSETLDASLVQRINSLTIKTEVNAINTLKKTMVVSAHSSESLHPLGLMIY